MKKEWWLAGWGIAICAVLLNAASIYKYEIKTLHSQTTTLASYRGKVTLIVNIASHSAYTSQLGGFEKLFSTYRSRGFTVLGFPTKQFELQEPLEGEDLEQFCKQKYGVTFPIYHYLKSRGSILSKNESTEWNFTKYLIDRNGIVIHRYSPRVKPEEIAADIEKIL